MGAPEKFPEHPEKGLMVPGVALNTQRSKVKFALQRVCSTRNRESSAHPQADGAGGEGGHGRIEKGIWATHPGSPLVKRRLGSFLPLHSSYHPRLHTPPPHLKTPPLPNLTLEDPFTHPHRVGDHISILLPSASQRSRGCFQLGGRREHGEGTFFLNQQEINKWFCSPPGSPWVGNLKCIKVGRPINMS